MGHRPRPAPSPPPPVASVWHFAPPQEGVGSSVGRLGTTCTLKLTEEETGSVAPPPADSSPSSGRPHPGHHTESENIQSLHFYYSQL